MYINPTTKYHEISRMMTCPKIASSSSNTWEVITKLIDPTSIGCASVFFVSDVAVMLLAFLVTLVWVLSVDRIPTKICFAACNSLVIPKMG